MGAKTSKRLHSEQATGAKTEQDEIETIRNLNGTEPEKDETVQNANIPQQIQEEKISNPHKFEDIVKRADNLTVGDIKDQLRTGIFLDKKKKKFWVEENGHNCFMLFARDLTIVWGDDERYWGWIYENETSEIQVEVAELKQVCWMEIYGKFEVSLLTPNLKYEAFIILKVKTSSFGWNSKPAKIQLKLPNGDVQKHQEKLYEKPKEQWIQIKAGEFETRETEKGDVEIGLFEWDNPSWKGGLVIKGVMICPK